jgi:hypothetical protein
MFLLQNVAELNESNGKLHGSAACCQTRNKSGRVRFITINLSSHFFVIVVEQAGEVALMLVVADTIRIPGPLLA